MQKITLYLTETEYDEFYEKNEHYFTHFKALTETVKKKPDLKLEHAKKCLEMALQYWPLNSGLAIGMARGLSLGTVSESTIKRAAKALGVVSTVKGFGKDRRAVWALPRHVKNPAGAGSESHGA